MQAYHEAVVSAQIALTSATDVYTWTPSHPVEIIRWGLVLDALLDVGVGATVKVDKRPTAGSDTGRGDGDIGALTTTGDLAQGVVWNDELAAPIKLLPGEQAVVEVTDAADTAGTGEVYIHYRRRPWHSKPTGVAGTDLRHVVEG